MKLFALIGCLSITIHVVYGEAGKNDECESMNSSKMINGTYVPALTKDGYGEYNMYGRLREVILGYSNNLVIQQLTAEQEATYSGVLRPELRTAIRQSDGKPMIETSSLIRKLNVETQILRETLESYDIKVHMAEPATPYEINLVGRNAGSFTQVFAAEPIWIVGRNVLENVWASDLGWAHLFPIRELHQPYIDNDQNILHYTAPQPGIHRDYIYEGGDVLNLGDGRILVGVMRSSTNSRGAQWVKRMLEHDGYRVEVIELMNITLHHITAVIGVAGPKLLIAYKKAFPNGLPDFIKDFEVIWVNEFEEALTTVPTSFMIDRETILIPEEAPKYLIKKLHEKGIKTVSVPWKIHSLFSGGPRCKISVIKRDIY